MFKGKVLTCFYCLGLESLGLNSSKYNDWARAYVTQTTLCCFIFFYVNNIELILTDFANIWSWASMVLPPLTPLAPQPLVGKASSLSRLYDHTERDTPQSAGLLWTSDQPDAETSTWQQNTHKRQISTRRRDSNQQSLQAGSHRPTP